MASWRYGNFKVVIRPNEAEFEPPHVHVFRKGGGQIKINLGSADKPPEPYKSWGMRESDELEAWRIVAERQAFFLEKWRETHGTVEYR